MRKNLLFMALFLILPGLLWAQGITVKGTVSDHSGALPGVSILEKGTTNGVATNIDGQYELTVSNGNATLIFSFMGYVTQEIPLNGRKQLDVVLKENTEMLEEVVVLAYGGTQKRSKVTNSIAKVQEDVFKGGILSNPAQALSGAVAGLKVTQSSGNPGETPTITLRGGTNFDGSGSPLVIIDGQVRESMSDINPDDIESMEVMKDAGATAIYGARSNNGVILITTKRGKAGRTSINFKAKVGWRYINVPYKFLNARDYIYWMRTAYNNATNLTDADGNTYTGWGNLNSLGQNTPHGTGNRYFDADGVTPLDGNKSNLAIYSTMNYTPDLAFLLNQGWETMTDPVYGGEIIFKSFDISKVNLNTPSFSQDYNLSMSGGNEKGSYYASIGYNDTDGNVLGNWYRRVTFTLNADYKIKEWLTSNSSFQFADAKWNGLPSTQASEANYFCRVMSLPPTMRGTNADGEYILGPNSGDGNQKINLDKLIRDNNTDKFTISQALTANLYKGLSLKVSGLWFFDEEKQEAFNKDFQTGPNSYNRTRSSSAYFNRKMNQTYNAVLNYDNEFLPEHNLNAMFGFEFYDKYEKGFSASGQGAAVDDFMDLNLTNPELTRSIDSWHSRERIMSFFGRLNYDYKTKYLISFVARRDGYSKLAKDNRWGFFPGVSAGWVFGKEDFMQGLNNVISFAKLRLSYGLNGNVNKNFVGNYTVQGAYGSGKYNNNTGYLLSTLPAPNLKWEKSNTFEVGLDLSFIENKINANFTYYNRLTSDKYANITIPTTSGFSSLLSNNGKIRNQGFETELAFKAINKGDWKWDINVNAAYNINRVVKLPDNGILRNAQNYSQAYNPKTGKLEIVGGYQEGREPGAVYGPKALGLYRSWEEVPENLLDKTSGNNGSRGNWLYGKTSWRDANANGTLRSGGLAIAPGDVRWLDVNNDGVIDDYDVVKLGRTTPRWTGGITTNLSWKGIALNVRMDYALGHTVVDYGSQWVMACAQGTYNTLTKTNNSFSATNPKGKWPTYMWADQFGKRNYCRDNNSMFVYKGDYLAFREVTLSYSLPKYLLNKLHMQGLDLSVTGQNLGYLTKAKDAYSPEVASATSGYPLPKILVLGLNLTF